MDNKIRQIENKIREIRGLESQINKYKEYLDVLQPKEIKKKNDPKPIIYNIFMYSREETDRGFNVMHEGRIEKEYYDIFAMSIRLIISDLKKRIVILELEIR